MIHLMLATIPRQLKACRPAATGFTLIELLTVISIVSILAIIIVPLIKEVRDKAHIATCAANLRVIGVGLLSYASDYGAMPAADSGGENALTWDAELVRTGHIDKPARSSSTLTCPNDPVKRTVGGADAISRSYACNSQVLYVRGNSPEHCLHGNLLQAELPAGNIVLMFERPTDANLYGRSWSIGFPAPFVSSTVSPNLSHKNGANWLMADGSIQYLDFTQILPDGSVTEQGNKFAANYFNVR